MRYKLACKFEVIQSPWAAYDTSRCSLLLLASDSVLSCVDDRMIATDFSGEPLRQWSLSGSIRFARVMDGPRGAESVLVACSDGSVMLVFLNNDTPVMLKKCNVPVRFADFSSDRKRLAVVTDDGTLSVYEIDMLSDEPAKLTMRCEQANATSVHFNTSLPSMLCWSDGRHLHTCVGELKTHTQPVKGHVVACSGLCITVLNRRVTQIRALASLVDAMHRYIRKQQWEQCFEVACFVNNDCDWRFLLQSALQRLNLDIAARVALRLGDADAARRVRMYQAELHALRNSDPVTAEPRMSLSIRADSAAINGRFGQAERLWIQAKLPIKALSMRVALCDFVAARRLIVDNKALSNIDLTEVVPQMKRLVDRFDNKLSLTPHEVKAGDTQAQLAVLIAAWLDEKGKSREAAEALALHESQGLRLIRLCMLRDLPDILASHIEVPCEQAVQREAATWLADCAYSEKYTDEERLKWAKKAKIILMRLGHAGDVLRLLAKAQKWDMLLETLRDASDEVKRDCLSKYAQHLCEQGQLPKAMAALIAASANSSDEHAAAARQTGNRVLRSLIQCEDYRQAASICTMLRSVESDEKERQRLQLTARLCVAYANIHDYTETKETCDITAEVALHSALFVCNHTARYALQWLAQRSHSDELKSDATLLHVDVAPVDIHARIATLRVSKALETVVEVALSIGALRTAEKALQELQFLPLHNTMERKRVRKLALRFRYASLCMEGEVAEQEEAVSPMCARCATTLPALLPFDACPGCGTLVERCAATGSPLVLAHFQAPGAENVLAGRIQMYKVPLPFMGKIFRSQNLERSADEEESKNESQDNSENILRLDTVAKPKHTSLETRLLHVEFDTEQDQSRRRQLRRLRPVQLSPREVAQLDASTVLPRYVGNVKQSEWMCDLVAAVPLQQCTRCSSVCLADAFELSMLQHKACPVCGPLLLPSLATTL
ncbi:MAG: hypothetical protein MHM6MM_004078 [Cercozoa sp. M6MM]